MIDHIRFLGRQVVLPLFSKTVTDSTRRGICWPVREESGGRAAVGAANDGQQALERPPIGSAIGEQCAITNELSFQTGSKNVHAKAINSEG